MGDSSYTQPAPYMCPSVALCCSSVAAVVDLDVDESRTFSIFCGLFVFLLGLDVAFTTC